MELPKIQSRDEYDRKSPPGKIRINVNDCPFCNILDDKSVIIWEGERWYLVYNIFPYSGNHQHIMAIPKSHIFYGRDLSRKYWEELEDIYKVVQDFYGDNEYFSFTRESFGGRTLAHYHMHFLPGIMEGKFLRKMLEVQGFPIIEKLD